MFCPYCGKVVEGDFVYCLNCGRKIPFRNSDEKSCCFSKVQSAGKERCACGENASDFNRLEMEFRALVKRLPSEALSHFKNVDKNAWRVVKAGMPEEDTYKRHGLVGPYAMKICGVVYHAYAKEDSLAASQVKFLSIWSGGAKKGIRRIRRRLNLAGESASHHFATHVTFFIALFGILLAALLLASRWGGIFR